MQLEFKFIGILCWLQIIGNDFCYNVIYFEKKSRIQISKQP